MISNKFRKQWVDALRSGDYNQGRNYLCVRSRQHGDRFCCLGVAADVKGVLNPGGEVSFAYGGGCHYLPSPVLKRLGLTSEAQKVLADMNDNSKTFAEIADAIESGEAMSPVTRRKAKI